MRERGTTAGDARDDDPLLRVENLRTTFATETGTVRAVDGVSFDVERGETVGLVGESGAGKSVTARSLVGLVEDPGRVVGGSVRLDGAELTDNTEAEWRDVRGGRIAMVFQDPLSRLNPVYTVGNQIEEALRIHRGLRGAAAREKAVELLEDVGIPDAARRAEAYPHEFSGGMCQRAVIAVALACDPDLLVCDEPTTALDVTIQAQILDLLDDLRAERDLAVLFITHDMGVVAEVCDRVNVMYAGEIVERAGVVDLFERPKHPYTQGLLDAVPARTARGERLATIEGEVPTPTEPATACRFAPRCPRAFDACHSVHPTGVAVSAGADDHTAACLHYPADAAQDDAVERHRERDGSANADADAEGGAE
ncbi:ABC transporter ATP-binding protein [Halarchaeum sp. CBA1220]|uniref:ABC transporter ATP-binding protein n=1 Tax=Halarchaeum sp. CBA1220 TaxID=1853682 RepID=UPI00351ABCF6